jgi:hypothetical protein
MKRLLIVFGILDIITIAWGFAEIAEVFWDRSIYVHTTFSVVVFYGVLLFSAYFLIRKKKPGLLLTYVQFPFRVAYMNLSFGFMMPLLTASDQLVNSPILMAFLVMMEVARIICTGYIHKKHFSKRKSNGLRLSKRA